MKFYQERATEDFDNFTSILFITNLAVNGSYGTNLTCEDVALKMS